MAGNDKMVHVFGYLKEKPTAHNTARELVEKRLASHVSIVPCTTVFKFSEAEPIESEESFLLMIRTRPANCETIAKLLAERDNFEPPECFSHQVDYIDEEFHKWVLERVPK